MSAQAHEITANINTATIAGIRLRSVSALWLRHWLAFTRYWKYAIAFLVIEPIAMLIGISIGLSRLIEDIPGTQADYAEFVSPGIIIGSAMFVSMSECAMGAFNRMENQLYETHLTAPVSVTEIMIGEIVWASTRVLISASAIAAIATAFGWIDEWSAIMIVIPVVLTGILFASVGLLFSATAPHIQFASLTFTIVGTPMFMFSGIFYPFEILPGWAEVVSNLLPLSPAVNLGRAFATNAIQASLIWDLIAIIVMIAIVTPIALFLLKRKLIT